MHNIYKNKSKIKEELYIRRSSIFILKMILRYVIIQFLKNCIITYKIHLENFLLKLTEKKKFFEKETGLLSSFFLKKKRTLKLKKKHIGNQFLKLKKKHIGNQLRNITFFKSTILHYRRKSSNLFTTVVAENQTNSKREVLLTLNSGSAGFENRARRKQVAHTGIMNRLREELQQKKIKRLHIVFHTRVKTPYRKYVIAQLADEHILICSVKLALRISHGFTRPKAKPHKKYSKKKKK